MAKKKVDEAITRPQQTRLVANQSQGATQLFDPRDLQAGVALMGTEVKALREGQASMADAFATLRRRRDLAAQPAHPGVSRAQLDQPRAEAQPQLLLHAASDTLVGKIRERQSDVGAATLYFTDGKVKVELALAARQADP